MSSTAKNVLLLAIVLLVCAAFAEGAARIVGMKPRVAKVNEFFVAGTDTTWSVPDSELGWINKPGTSRSIEEGAAQMHFWSDGRRASRPEPAPKDGLPVMIIGGSNAQSYGVRDEDSFVWRLAERYPQLWFENFGGGGYSTIQALLIAKRALGTIYRARKPKLILLAFDDAHMLRNVADQSWIFSISDPEGRYVVPPYARLVGDKLAPRPFVTIGYWALERQSALVTAAHDAWLRKVAYNTARDALPVTRKVIDELAAFAREQGALFGVMVLEDRAKVTPQLFGDAPFPHADCSAPGRDDPQKYLLGGNSHPNPALHAYFTDCIATWLDAQVLPQLPPGSGQ